MNELIRGPDGRWLAGNPGRPVGSRNKLAERVLDTFLRDFQEHGAAALVREREERPSDYWRIATQLLPQQVLVNAFVAHEDTSPFASLSPEEKRKLAAQIMATIRSVRPKLSAHRFTD